MRAHISKTFSINRSKICTPPPYKLSVSCRKLAYVLIPVHMGEKYTRVGVTGHTKMMSESELGHSRIATEPRMLSSTQSLVDETEFRKITGVQVRVNSRSSGSGCSPDSYSCESGRSSRNNKQKPVIRNGNRLFPTFQDSKQASPVPDPNPSITVADRENFWKISALQREIDVLRTELDQAKITLASFQDREQKLKQRLSEQAQKMLERGAKFENLCLGERRPTALVRHYGNLYAQARVDTLDALDALRPLQDADELKSKILFSVIVLSFRSVQNAMTDIKDQIYSVLQVKTEGDNDTTVRELEQGIAAYLRKSAEEFNLSKNIKEVCSQIYATLYDYPCLKTCPGLVNYTKDCVRLAWCLTNQNPPFVIDYETRTFRREMHMRFHTSNVGSDAIKSYLWPTLLEGENGPCVHRGVVLT